tara:strand:- start:358 stop:843 length:486 start_codon:yes stop_codon:yes gene_type:complete
MKKSSFNKIVKELTEVIGKQWTEVNHREIAPEDLTYPDDTTFMWEHKAEKVSDWKVEVNYNQTDTDYYKDDSLGNRVYRKYPVASRYIAFYFSETLKSSGLVVNRIVYITETDTLQPCYKIELETILGGERVTDISKLITGMRNSVAEELYEILFNRASMK